MQLDRRIVDVDDAGDAAGDAAGHVVDLGFLDAVRLQQRRLPGKDRHDDAARKDRLRRVRLIGRPAPGTGRSAAQAWRRAPTSAGAARPEASGPAGPARNPTTADSSVTTEATRAVEIFICGHRNRTAPQASEQRQARGAREVAKVPVARDERRGLVEAALCDERVGYARFLLLLEDRRPQQSRALPEARFEIENQAGPANSVRTAAAAPGRSGSRVRTTGGSASC